MLPPVMLPVELTVPGVARLPPVMVPVTFNGLITLPLRLMLPVLTLPPVIVPVALTIPAVSKLLA